MNKPNDSGKSKASQDEFASEFSRQAEDQQPGFIREFTEFLLQNKKWWLAPIIILLLLFGVLVIVGGTGAAPFIYTLF